MTAHEDSVLIDLVRGSLDHCVKCTICETYCPYSDATPLFPGPKYVGPQAERFRTGEEVSPTPRSTTARAAASARKVCPQGVHIAEINTRAKARLAESEGIPLRNQLLGRPDKLGALGTPVAPIANWSLNNKPLRALAHKLLGIHKDAAVPHFAGRTFRRWAKRHVSSPQATKEVVLFYGCGTNYYEPELGEKIVGILEHNGFRVTHAEAGLLWAAAAVQRDLPGGALVRSPARAPAGAPRAQGRADRRAAHELHPHAQARGSRDPRPRRGPGPARRLRARVGHHRVPARPARPRGAAHGLPACRGDRRLPRALPAAGPQHRQAGARPLRAHPRPRDRRDGRALLWHRRDLRAQGGEAPDLARRRRRPVLAGARGRPEPRRLRRGDLPLAHRAGDRRHERAPDGRPAPRLRPGVDRWFPSSSSRTAPRWRRA